MSLSKTQQKKEALKELVWYICRNYNNQLFETKLWKLVFFCDTDHFQKYDVPLTSVPYIKNRRGPTPVYNIAKEALGELVKDKHIMKADNGTYVALKDYELKYIDTRSIDAINTTCDKYYKLTVNEICTLAHRDPVYLATENYNEILDFSFVSYRDDGGHEDIEETEGVSTEVSFSKKAKDKLFELALA